MSEEEYLICTVVDRIVETIEGTTVVTDGAGEIQINQRPAWLRAGVWVTIALRHGAQPPPGWRAQKDGAKD